MGIYNKKKSWTDVLGIRVEECFWIWINAEILALPTPMSFFALIWQNILYAIVQKSICRSGAVLQQLKAKKHLFFFLRTTENTLFINFRSFNTRVFMKYCVSYLNAELFHWIKWILLYGNFDRTNHDTFYRHITKRGIIRSNNLLIML